MKYFSLKTNNNALINLVILFVFILSANVSVFAQSTKNVVDVNSINSSATKKVEKKAAKKFATMAFLKKGTMINTNKYENIKNTDIYRVDNRIFRISRNTNEILDVLK